MGGRLPFAFRESKVSSAAPHHGLARIWAASAARVFVVGSAPHELLVTTDGGGRWQLAGGHVEGPSRWTGVGGNRAGVVCAVGKNGGIILSTDGGEQFVSRPRYFDPRQFMGWDIDDVWVAPDGGVFVLSDHGVHRSVDGCETFDQVAKVAWTLHRIWGSDERSLYVAGADGIVLRSSDGGASFREQQLAIPGMKERPAFVSIWGLGDELWLCGTASFHSSDRGETWQRREQRLIDLWGSAPDDLYGASGKEGLLHSSDGGITWTQLDVAKDRDVRAVFGVGGTDLYAAGLGGFFLHGERAATSPGSG
jgi:photosystem II stability/assembly factor-like uncharacterized protein